MTIINKVSNKTLMPGITPIPDVPDAPTIGTATKVDASSATVAFTAAATGGAVTTFTATSTPGSITGTSATSPITVSGLTSSTSYTFTVKGTNATATGPNSAASNSITTDAPNSFESIATVYGTGSSTFVTFSSIPQTYKHLQLRVTSRNGRAVSIDSLLVYFNGVITGSQYAYHAVYGDGASASSYSGTSASTGTFLGLMAGSSAATSIYGPTIIDILDYTNTNKYKTAKGISATELNGSGSIYITSGLWMNTAAISSISLGSNNTGANWTTDSVFSLYGIKG